MYSMPIVGTNANLYFPSERSQEPMVIGCVRKNGSSCEKFSNVDNRYFATESGNNLDMLPDAINFSRPGLSATFNDGGGVNLSSSSTLSINAGTVGLFAGNITIQGQSKVIAKKGGSIISLENDFYNDAGIVKENGRDRTTNASFDDDPQNGAAEAKAAMMASIEAALGAISAAILGAIGKIGSCLPMGMGAQAEGNTGNQAISETKNDKFIDKCRNFMDDIYNKVVGQEITLSEEKDGNITYSTKKKSNGDFIVQKFDKNLKFEGFSINAPIKVKVPFTEDYVGINPSISFGKEIEYSIEGSYKNGKTEDTTSGSLGISYGLDDISIFAEGKIEDKDGISISTKVEHKLIDFKTARVVVAVGAVVVVTTLSPIPGDEVVAASAGVKIIGELCTT